MREILFRGKRVDNNEWVYGSFIHNSIDCPCIIDNDAEQYEVILETIGQFTGLTDKNGVKIFEGDVLRFQTFGFEPQTFETTIQFTKGGFNLENGRSMFYFGQKDFSKMDDAKIIGNIYDNN